MTEDELKNRREAIRLSREIDKLLAGQSTGIATAALAASAAMSIAVLDLAAQQRVYTEFGALLEFLIRGVNQKSGKTIMKGEEFKVVLDDNTREDIANDPKLAASLNEATARMRAALDGIDYLDRKAIEKAMREIGAELILDEDDIDRVKGKVEAANKAKKTTIN
jgi:hypothetical protein